MNTKNSINFRQHSEFFFADTEKDSDPKIGTLSDKPFISLQKN